MFLMLLALAVDAGSADADQRLSDMTAVYQEVCLRGFPNDKAVADLMATRGARELSAEEVKVTMRDDPARGWELKGGGATVWLEFPPFHACSVRWNTPQAGSLEAYRTVADRYESQQGGFAPIQPYDADQGAIHIHAVGEQRTLPNQAKESLFVIDQTITDPKRREAGETGVVRRFVHQFTPPPAGGAK